MNYEEAKTQKVACIYKLTFPNGKSYIGQTKNLKDRLKLYSSAIRFKKDKSMVELAVEEFGLYSVSIDILAKPTGLEGDDLLLVLSILEIKYIREHNTLAPNGYNASIGGEVLGIPTECISTKFGLANYSGSKPVLCYDIDGNFVKEFESIERCAYVLGVNSNQLSAYIDKRMPFKNEYLLRFKRYGEIPEKILPFKKKVIEKVVVNKIYEDKVIVRERVEVAPKNQVLKYNADGEYCGIYDTATDAAVSIGSKNILKGVLRKGYIFFDYDGGEIRQNIGKVDLLATRLPKYSDFLMESGNEKVVLTKNRGWSKLINDFRIAQCDLDGDLIEVYDSIKDASYKTGLPYSGIWACVFGKTRKSGGYIWRKYEEEDN